PNMCPTRSSASLSTPLAPARTRQVHANNSASLTGRSTPLIIVAQHALPSFPTRRSSDLPRLHRAVDGERHRRRLPRDVAGQHQRDRKSTRLNSSHVEISYAVFCLKKKSKKVSVSCAFTQGTRDQL